MNHAFSVPFEPGSVFKVITLSAALETTNLRPKARSTATAASSPCSAARFTTPTPACGWSRWRPCWPNRAISARSRSGCAWASENMYDYVRRFGFGQRTGMPLPGESPGKVYRLERWGKTSLASVSMGQEVSVTTLQLAQAASVVANGGMLVKPRLVLKQGDRTEPVAAAGARAQARERHHDAPDDGRRGARRHRQPARAWPGIRAAARPARRRSTTTRRSTTRTPTTARSWASRRSRIRRWWWWSR